MYSTNHRNPTPSSISDTSPGLVKLIASTLRYHLFSGFSASNPPLSRRLPFNNYASPLFRPLVLRSSLLYAIHLYSSRSGSSVPRPWSLTHTFLSVSYLSIIPLLYCACVLVVLLSLFWICMYSGEPIKTVNNISQLTYRTVDKHNLLHGLPLMVRR